MYRIELSPGEETVFRSIEELAVAIKRGVVTSRARIFHNASNRWLPIQFHPHYKVAVSMPLTQAALVAGPPVKPLSSLTLQQPADPEPPVPIAAPSARFPTPVEEPVRKKRVRAERPAGDRRGRRHSKPRRQLRIALVGALLVGGAQWVLSAPLFSRTDAPTLIRSHRRLLAAPANTAAMVPVITTPSAPTAPASFGGVPVTGPVMPLPKPDSMSSPVESAATPEIEPAPSTIEASVPAAPRSDSLTSKMVDSTNKKTIKRILRAVSGASVREKTPARR